MMALHLLYQHWFISCILVTVATGGVARIIYAVRGVCVHNKDDSEDE